MKVGFIGLGHMGSGMAANLIRAGNEVTVYNRGPGKAQKLLDQGAKEAKQVSEACGGEAVFTMLPNDEAVESVVLGEKGILATLGRSGAHISSSTISVALSKRLAAMHKEAGQYFVAAPVFGRPEAAAQAKLFVMAGGEPDAVSFCMPLLEVIGQKTFVMSERPEAASLSKLSGNFLIASVFEALGEALSLVTKGGLDRNKYLDLLTSTLFDAPVYKTYGKAIVDRKFEPSGFPAPLAQKDIRLALAAGDELNVPMPIASLLRDRFLTLLAHGGESLDWAAIGGMAEKDAAQ